MIIVSEVPAWSISKADGAELRQWLQSDHSIRVEANILSYNMI